MLSSTPYMKLLIFIGINVGGYVGWALAENFGLLIAFIASGIGSILGVYAGWWAARRYLA